MHSIVAIGGGYIGERQTEAIDRYALELTGVENPSVLFVPTASSDDPNYSQTFTHYYQSLGANVSTLELTKSPSPDQVSEAILSADMIYCGGGDTRLAVEMWQGAGIPELLAQTKLQERVQVLGGLSAGANIWFEFCSSDLGVDDGPLHLVNGLGLIPNMLVSPHHVTEAKARDAFIDSTLPLPNRKGFASTNALAIDDCAAVVIEPGIRPYAINSQAGRNVTLVSPRIGQSHRRSFLTIGRPPQ